MELLNWMALDSMTMSSQPSSRPRRALKAGGPPATITAGLGVGATGIAGNGIEAKTEPIADGVAQTIGLDPHGVQYYF